MAELKHLYLICYDIRCPKRWRKIYKLLEGYGERIQYSIFRCTMTQRTREKLRWELSKLVAAEDSLLIIRICHRCAESIPTYNQPGVWCLQDDPYIII
jgi:CRISPR-associated protein Cas2